jgi:hypothetical protein
MILSDYTCTACGTFEAMVPSPAPDAICCPSCATAATWAPSPISGRIKLGEVTRGKVDAAPPGAMDTRLLGEGMPMKEWKAGRDKWRQEERRKILKEQLA